MLYSKDVLSFEDGKIVYKIPDEYNHRYKVNPPNSAVESLYEWISVTILALSVFIICFMYVFRVATVMGRSMEPTLLDEQRLILLSTQSVKAKDIIVIEQDDDYLIKRVIAVSGDKIRIDSMAKAVYINGVKLDEPFIQGETASNSFGDEEQIVPQGHLFVMGDNRENSFDSREIEKHFINEKLVVGKALVRYYPFKEIKVFNR